MEVMLVLISVFDSRVMAEDTEVALWKAAAGVG